MCIVNAIPQFLPHLLFIVPPTMCWSAQFFKAVLRFAFTHNTDFPPLVFSGCCAWLKPFFCHPGRPIVLISATQLQRGQQQWVGGTTGEAARDLSQRRHSQPRAPPTETAADAVATSSDIKAAASVTDGVTAIEAATQLPADGHSPHLPATNCM